MKDALHPAYEPIPDPKEGMINDEQELAECLGVETPERIGKALFKSTRCGICYQADERGVTVAGYAEGADAECDPHRLDYPFTRDTFNEACQQADEEGVQMWNEWNAQEWYEYDPQD